MISIRLRHRYHALLPAGAFAFAVSALGLGALHRFVEHPPLTHVHQRLFGVLAVESEPIDPKL